MPVNPDDIFMWHHFLNKVSRAVLSGTALFCRPCACTRRDFFDILYKERNFSTGRPAALTLRKGWRKQMDYYKMALELHKQHQGKIEVVSKVPVKTREDLSTAYTPGVAEPCREIAKDPAAAYTYTSKGNLVAVVSNGTAVLGLGDIGAAASQPVMEGKAILFKEFGGVDAFPICLDTHDSAASTWRTSPLLPALRSSAVWRRNWISLSSTTTSTAPPLWSPLPCSALCGW